MSLTSFEFVAFLAFSVLARGLLRSPESERWLLLIASLCFSLVAGPAGTMVILIITLVDFSIGRAMERESDPVRRKRLLRLSLTTSLGLLGFFKYTGFVLENLRALLASVGIDGAPSAFIPPATPGISFFTFASISYVVDVYNKRIKPTENIRDYGLFLSFFPKLLSGPIARASSFLPQLRSKASLGPGDIETAFAYVLIGAVKKLVIADQIAGHVDLIFAAPGRFDSVTLLQGAVGYVVQIYCDFSGYSDIAVGVARLFGYKLPENFQMPLSAPTITDFWRRWHITMSTWFRDYLFLPLEMARRRSAHPMLRTTSNVLLTWVVCGLWHGPSWSYAVWGAIHGAAMAVHMLWRSQNPVAGLRRFRTFSVAWTMLSHTLTLMVVVVSDVYFRAPSIASANVFIGRLLRLDMSGTRMLSPYILPAVAVVITVHVLIHRDSNWAAAIAAKPAPIRLAAYASLLCALVLLGATNVVPFVYVQF